MWPCTRHNTELSSCCCVHYDYVIGFAKNYPELHIQFIPQHKSYTPALSRHTKHMAIDGQVCFHRWLFSDLVKPGRCTTAPVESVNGINKDMCGAKLLPMIISAYPVDCVCFYHLLMTQHSCLCPGHLRLSTLPTTYPLICATHDTTVAVNKVAQNPAVLAS